MKKNRYVYGFDMPDHCVYGDDSLDDSCSWYTTPLTLKQAEKGLKTLCPAKGERMAIYKLVPVKVVVAKEDV